MAELVKDVVCKMDVDPDTAPARSDFRGETYYFCAEGCKLAFDANPERYLNGSTQPMEAATGQSPRRWWEFWKA